MTQRFFVPGPLPSLNEMIAAAKGYNGRGFAYSKMKQEWGGWAMEAIKKAKIKPMKSCTVVCEWREATKKRDPDNITVGKKFILDSLVSAGILKNDGWNEIVGFMDTWTVDKEKPGVYVELRG